jgi:hypothetical protein
MPFQTSLMFVGKARKKGASLRLGSGLPRIIRLGWKGVPGTNALAYHEKSSLTAVNFFITLATGHNQHILWPRTSGVHFIKLLFFVIDTPFKQARAFCHCVRPSIFRILKTTRFVQRDSLITPDVSKKWYHLGGRLAWQKWYHFGAS